MPELPYPRPPAPVSPRDTIAAKQGPEPSRASGREIPLALGIPGQNYPTPNARNTIVTGPAGLDTDQGPLGNTPTSDPVPTMEQITARAALHFRHLLEELKDQGFDYSHPVDEYAPQGMPAPAAGITYANVVTILPDYDMPEKIENILVIVPVGATLATLQLGQRTLDLYSGAALTAPLLITVPHAGVILNSDDPRILTISPAGTITSAPYLGLTGYALTRGQFS